MDIDLLKHLILDQKEAFSQSAGLIGRDTKESVKDLISAKQIIVISGVRRAGKSSFLKLIAKELMKKREISADQLFYVNFDDEFFVDFKKEDFNKLLSAYYEICGIKNKKIYCFFDEIQNVEYWEKWIHKLYETGNFKIFITGSNSSLLSSEIATSLTGRNYTMEIFPFSFPEFLRFKKIDWKGSLTTKQESLIRKEFNIYLKSGGFPETIEAKLNILPDFYKNIIYRDIISRFNIKNAKEFRELSLYLASNNGSLMSYRELAKRIEGIGSSMTIKNYVSHLEDAYLFFPVRKLDSSVKRQIINPFKIYGIDNGLLGTVAFGLSDNYNKLYENLTFLSLRRKKRDDIYYYKADYETDFVVLEKNKASKVIQVCYSLKDIKTEKREKRGLLRALNDLKAKTGFIINNDIEKEEKENGKIIKYIPLWKWLLKS
ncbi:MAG: ATP-binding protein [Candidatus Falkowbacteria bacterium]